MNQFVNHKLIHVKQNEIDEVVKELPKGRTVGEFSATEEDDTHLVLGNVKPDLGQITITHITSEISRTYDTGWDTNWGYDFNKDVKNGVF